MKIVIIKYNAGNTHSVQLAVRRLGYEAIVSDDPAVIMAADRVIFPGVGNAKAAMESLREKGLDTVIPSLKQPVLGICLGMQLLCDHSEENDTTCLGIIPAAVKKFKTSEGNKVPHTGWNELYDHRSALLQNVPANAFVYYVHSYYVERCAETSATTNYILPFSGMIEKDNFFGVQFHTERSADVGDGILLNFLTQGK